MKKIVVCLLFVIIAALSLAHIVVANTLSTTGIELGKAQDDLRHYTKENTLLAEKLLIASSFTQIASSAAQLGFSHEKQAVFLTSQPLALKR